MNTTPSTDLPVTSALPVASTSLSRAQLIWDLIQSDVYFITVLNLKLSGITCNNFKFYIMSMFNALEKEEQDIIITNLINHTKAHMIVHKTNIH